MFGWNKEGFLCGNSYGPNNGVFLLRYDQFKYLFTRYSIFDRTDSDGKDLVDDKKYLLQLIKIKHKLTKAMR